MVDGLPVVGTPFQNLGHACAVSLLTKNECPNGTKTDSFLSLPGASCMLTPLWILGPFLREPYSMDPGLLARHFFCRAERGLR